MGEKFWVEWSIACKNDKILNRDLGIIAIYWVWACEGAMIKKLYMIEKTVTCNF